MFNEFTNWLAMVELPVFVTMFRLMNRNRQENDNNMTLCKDALADFKLHVARNYVSINYLKDVEDRLTNHLLRIEKKLDEVGKNK